MKLKDWDDTEDFGADLGTEGWEELPPDMDEEDSLREEAASMPDQAPEEEGRWDETEVESKPGVAYRWKKFALDEEPDAVDGRQKSSVGSQKEKSGDGPAQLGKPAGEEEGFGAHARQKPQNAAPSRGGKKSAKTSGKAQEKAEGEGWEDELPPMKPWTKALVFLGLAVVAAVICGFLWRFAHPGNPEGGEGQDSSAQMAEAPEDSDRQAPKLDLDAPDDAEGSAAGSDAESAPGDGTESGAGQLGAESVSGEGTEPGAGQAGAGSAPGEGTEPGLGQPGTEAAPGAGTETGAGQPGAGSAPGDGTEPGAGQSGTESTPGEEQEPVSGTENMTFQTVQESVTPKDVVNLRLVPTTADADNIVTQARNGETLSRIGINPDTGWSQIDYNGQTLYAVSQYLTTDLGYRPAVQPADPNRVSTASGRVIIFQDCDDWISPKEYVNLRTEPSTTEGDATVSCQLNYGEKVHRTGYSTDSGWSRVEHNGQVLYVVTSLMYQVAAE